MRSLFWHKLRVRIMKKISTFRNHSKAVTSVAFSPDGKTLASGSEDKTFKIYDLDTGFERHSRREGYSIDSVAFSPDGKKLAVGYWGTVSILEDQREIFDLKGHSGEIHSVAFNPDSTILASGSEDGIRLWEVSSGELIDYLDRHNETVNSVAFSPDGINLASGSDDNTVNIWDIVSGTNITLEHSKAVNSVAFSPDGTTLASCGSDGIKLWEVSSGELIINLTARSNWFKSVAFSPDGKILASGGWAGIKLWDVATQKEIATLLGVDDVRSVAFSPDGKILATGSGDDTVDIWSISKK